MSMIPKKPNVIKANYRLQQKVGAGPLDEKIVKASQQVMDTNQVDFEPLGLAILRRLKDALDHAKEPGANMAQIKDTLTTPVMELKANASTFRYPLIGNLANIMLSFLEAIREMDEDALEIVRAHYDTLHMIVVRKLSGDGGDAGRQLTTELQLVCDRYYHKKFGK